MLLHPTSQVSAWYLVISSHGMVNISKGEPQLAAIHRYALLFSKTKKTRTLGYCAYQIPSHFTKFA